MPNADAIEARRVANVTVMTNEDTALQSNHTNVNALTNTDNAIEARRVANLAGAVSQSQLTTATSKL